MGQVLSLGSICLFLVGVWQVDADDRAVRRWQVIHEVQLRRALLARLRSRWGWWWARNPARLKGKK